MKIDKNKPLSDHTKLDYDECCAKLILEELFPERYSNLIIADRPDLQGDNVGIEVTIADAPEYREMLANWNKAYNSQNDKQKEHCVQRMDQMGAKYNGGVQVWPGYAPKFDMTKKAVDTKIQKLKKGLYGSFNRNELFIFTDTWYYDGLIETAKQYFFNNYVSDCYKTIYLLSEGLNLHIFETENSIYRQIKIDYLEQCNRNRRARKMIEDAEET